MESGYKVWGQDIGNLLEFFTIDEQNTYTVVDSRFTNGNGAYKKGGVELLLVVHFPLLQALITLAATIYCRLIKLMERQ